MRSSHSLDRLDVIFDDEHAVADAGLVLPATLAQHLGLRDLIDECVDLGEAAGRANVGHKAMTLIHSALAGGDCIDDADALRAGDTEIALGHGVLAPSTLGTFLRSFTWGHARQIDRASGELLARAWTAGAGPGDEPVTVDVDSTICETYGLAKQGGGFGHTKVRGYHPLLAAVAGTGDDGSWPPRASCPTTRGAAGLRLTSPATLQPTRARRSSRPAAARHSVCSDRPTRSMFRRSFAGRLLYSPDGVHWSSVTLAEALAFDANIPFIAVGDSSAILEAGLRAPGAQAQRFWLVTLR